MSARAVAVAVHAPRLREEVAFRLRHEGFAIETCSTGAGLARALAQSRAGVAVIAGDLPDETGVAACARLRRLDAHLGLVLLADSDARTARLQALAAGADASLPLPLDPDELALVAARLHERAAAQSEQAGLAAAPSRAAGAHWALDLQAGQLVAPNGSRKRVSHSERLLLGALAGEPQPRSHLELAAALGLAPDQFDKHRIEVIVSRLRSSVQRETGVALPLASVRGLGYALDAVRLV